MRLRTILCIVGVAVLVWAAPQQPTSMKGNEAARAEYAKGQAAQRESDWDGAVEHYGKAVELDPDYFDAHENYVFTGTSGPKNYNNPTLFAELEARYQAWTKEHPDKAVYLYSLGHLYFHKDPERAVGYYQAAVKLDPKFAPAWDSLGIMAEAQGKLDEERDFERKAAAAWPDHERYASHAANAWMMADFPSFWKASMEYIEKHPSAAVNQLNYMGMRALRLEDSRRTLELMHDKYLPQAAGSLPPLFQMYLREDPKKALKLAAEIAAAVPNDKQWPQLVSYAQAVVDGNLEALDKVTLPARTDRRMLDVTRARALDAAAQTLKAYADLMKVFASKPSDEVRNTLLAISAKLHKDASEVNGEVFAQRSAAAKPGIAFSTSTYPDNRPTSLDGLRGKVFLLNFWYPLCGPCRGEFPFLQAVLDKYKSRGFSIVAVNGHPKEDSWVMPLLNGWKLGFIPVHDEGNISEAYKVRGYPSNFLYGSDGRIYYSPGPVNNYDARRELELQIEGLLEARP
jgi:tetratricopeptide (TPR) repeat protein